MRICDVPEDQITVGMRVRSLANRNDLGTITYIERERDNLAHIVWDHNPSGWSGFYGNDCMCEIDDFVECQRKVASNSERIPDDGFETADSYKIVYRSCAVLLATGSPYLNPNGKTLTKIETVAFLRAAHPYFAWLLRSKENMLSFEGTYDCQADKMCWISNTLNVGTTNLFTI